jgi:hypothetical protein
LCTWWRLDDGEGSPRIDALTHQAHSRQEVLHMTRIWVGVWGGALCWSLIGASIAGADVTGSYDGGLVPKNSTESIAAAAVFSQAGTTVTGTMALPRDLLSFGGEYLVAGKATPKKVKVSGTGVNGVLFKYKGKIVGEVLQGKAKLKGAAGKLKGTLAITRNTPLADGSGCDGVYAANETLFLDNVLGALAACAACHGPGLQAGASRLHVNFGDPLATARQMAPLIDAASPATSRLLLKPLNALPHGGGQPILPASSQEQILLQWASLIAAAACN